MAEAYLRRTPLAHRGLAAKADVTAGADIVLGERAHRCQIVVRGNAEDAQFRQALHSVLGLSPPGEANTFASAGAFACLWLGPDEWLILGPGGGEGELTARLRAAFGGIHAAAVDISESRTTITVGGPQARAVLAKGTSIDLHPRVFGPGGCVQTGFAGASIILCQTDDAPTFEMLVLNSFAEHVWAWIEGACREYRIAVSVDPVHESQSTKN
jgi:sarcosine oxidase subunit gamma